MMLLEVANQSYRMAGVLKHAGQGPNESQQTEILHIYNSLLDGLKIERWFMYYIIRTVVHVTANQKEYTVGSQELGADWVIERPEKIMRTGIIVPGSTEDQPSEIQVYTVQSYEEYARIVNKNTGSTLIQVNYYQAKLPLGLCTVWPRPTVSKANAVVLYTPQTVQEFQDINGEFIVPQGYREYLEYAGAVAVHDRYPSFPLAPNVERKAIEYKSRIQAMQWTPSFIRSDDGSLNHGVGTPGWVFNGRTTLA